MSITLELPLEEEQSLRRQAELAGRDVNEYLREIVREKVFLSPASLTDEEWERLADEAADIVPSSVPPLSDYAVSREAMYEGRF